MPTYRPSSALWSTTIDLAAYAGRFDAILVQVEHAFVDTRTALGLLLATQTFSGLVLCIAIELTVEGAV